MADLIDRRLPALRVIAVRSVKVGLPTRKEPLSPSEGRLLVLPSTSGLAAAPVLSRDTSSAKISCTSLNR